MLEEIYLERRETIDNTVKQAIRQVERKMKSIENQERETNKELIDKIEENYNIKLASVCKEVYLQGLKDVINLILEANQK